MEESILTAPWRYLRKIHIMTQNNITQHKPVYYIFINLVKKHWVSDNSYHFTCFHANLASTYYTYVSDEVKQFVWHSERQSQNLYPVLTQICLTPKAIGFLLYQIKRQSPFSQSAVGVQMGRKMYLFRRALSKASWTKEH